ncbi:PH domain-containing protein [Flavobacterium sp. D11R37]|uniref:PH domain-containing protein n=1 Tax=Flavobacterium coralii TaxID=2838017 RepID=UPI001CA601BC|nr:PH domain-containing protein [Flavobacterium coralii]MBY8961962.1 PH domain-containing protein [Flavobacterium coralii]
MKSDFSSPQRQSLVGVVVMFGDTLQSTLRSLWPFLLVWAFRINQMNRLYVVTVIGAALILTAVIAYLKFYNFTFFLDEENEEFVIRKGILNKSRIAIPLDKIQQVNINQSLIQKFIGVHSLEVDTAGSSKKEVTIKAITHDLALSLKERLLDSEKKNSENDEVAASRNTNKAYPFISISFASLLKTGITSNYARSFALLFAFVITVYQNIEDYFEGEGYENDPLDEYVNGEVLFKFAAFIAIAIIVLTLLVNLSRTILKYFGYTITLQNKSLLLSYGLLNTKNTIIRPEKVQIVAVGRNYFQKKMDIQDVRISQASNNDDAKEQQKEAIEIPGCSEVEKNELLTFLLGQVPEKGEGLKPNIRKIILNTVRFIIIPLALYFVFAIWFYNELFEYIIFLPLYLAFIISMIYFGYRNSRLYSTKDFIIKQSGAWDVDNEFLAPHKIQAVRLTQYFWQKKANLGAIKLYTAGGNLTFNVADYSRLKELANYWLYNVETTDKNWM